MTKVSDRIAAAKSQGRDLSTYVALKQIAREDRIDLSEFYPDIKLESSLKNIDKRNDILMTYLLKQSKSPLQLGLVVDLDRQLVARVRLVLDSPCRNFRLLVFRKSRLRVPDQFPFRPTGGPPVRQGTGTPSSR